MNISILADSVESLIGSIFIDSGYNVKSMDLLIYNNHTCITNHYRHSQYEFINGDKEKSLKKTRVKKEVN